MTLLDEPRTRSTSAPDHARAEPAPRPDRSADAEVIDLRPDRPVPRGRSPIDPSGRITYRGMRIRRVRLGSVAQISFVFWLLGYLVVIGTIAAVWNVARALGFVDSFEETMITSLGLESFEVDGAGLFGIAAVAFAVLCVLGWLATIAMAAVYNATCGVFGGLAVETGPPRRRRRVFSLRHRGFVTVSE